MRGLLLSAALLSGCATVTRGTTQNFTVRTEPPGARVTTTLITDGEAVGCAATPCTMEVPRRSEFIARVALDGHQELAIAVRSTGDREAVRLGTVGQAGGGGTVVGAYALGGIASSSVFAFAAGSGALVVGAPLLFVDAATGALSTVTPNPVEVSLLPLTKEMLDDGVGPVHFVDPLALPGEAEAIANAVALASTQGLDTSAEAIRRLGLPEDARAEVAKLDAALDAVNTRYDAQCRDNSGRLGVNADYEVCRGMRGERRALKAEIERVLTAPDPN